MQIKFSHNYPKLWHQKKAELLAVRIIDAQAVQINQDLIEYDTGFETVDDFMDIQKDYYQLPKQGKLIQLIFIGDKDIPFCTLRRHTEQKYQYYFSCIGEVFEVVLTSTTDSAES